MQSDDDQFVELMAAFDEALAGGRADDFLAGTPPPQLADRLQRAQTCLRRLTANWAGQWGNQCVRVGRFQIERELGRGGFGVVYLAYDPSLKRQVALKVPRLEALVTSETRQRFLREAELAAGLDHPNIVPVYEAGEAGAVVYIASAYCSGPDLRRWLVEHPESLPPHAAATLVRLLAESLEYCHQHGILHRDLKPSNVLLMPLTDPTDNAAGLPFVPRLTDFGLAKLMEASLSETHSSVVLGTPLYMAPEQAEGRTHAVGPSTDVYALGVILYELLTRRPPFTGESLLEVLGRVRGESPVAPRRFQPALPRDLETVCLKCLAKEPEQRYRSARDLADDLRRFEAGEPIQSRPPNLRCHLGNWSRSPARIREAGVFTIALQTGLTLWCLLSTVWVWFLRPPEQGVVSQSIVEFIGLIVLIVVGMSFPQMWLGAKILVRRRWAMWSELIFTTLPLVMALAVLAGGVSIFPDYDRDGLGRWAVHSLLAFLLTIQGFLIAMALVADQNLRRLGR